MTTAAYLHKNCSGRDLYQHLHSGVPNRNVWQANLLMWSFPIRYFRQLRYVCQLDFNFQTYENYSNPFMIFFPNLHSLLLIAHRHDLIHIFPVVGKSRYFVLSSQFTFRLKPCIERPFWKDPDHRFCKDHIMVPFCFIIGIQ